jgi:hypothetical protein
MKGKKKPSGASKPSGKGKPSAGVKKAAIRQKSKPRDPFTGRFISRDEQAIIKSAGKEFAKAYFEAKYFEKNKDKIQKAVKAGEPEKKAAKRFTRISDYQPKKIKFDPKKDKVDVLTDLGFGRNFDKEIEYYYEKNTRVTYTVIDRNGVIHKLRSLKQAKKITGEILSELWREADKLTASARRQKKSRKGYSVVPIFRMETAYKSGTSAPVNITMNFAENNIDGNLSDDEIDEFDFNDL